MGVCKGKVTARAIRIPIGGDAESEQGLTPLTVKGGAVTEDVSLRVWALAEGAARQARVKERVGDRLVVPMPAEVPDVTSSPAAVAEGGGGHTPELGGMPRRGRCPFGGGTTGSPRLVPVLEVVPEVGPLRSPSERSKEGMLLGVAPEPFTRGGSHKRDSGDIEVERGDGELSQQGLRAGAGI